MQILGLLGMYFDAVVVEIKEYLLFSQYGQSSYILRRPQNYYSTYVHLRSLLNKLACLAVLNTVKRASSFNRDLRVQSKVRWRCLKFIYVV
jgi:hypothetical protein